MFPATTIEPVMMEKRTGATPNSFQAGWGDYDRAMAALETALKPGPYLFGNDFTAADLYIGSALGFGMRFGMVDKRPTFVEFAERTSARPFVVGPSAQDSPDRRGEAQRSGWRTQTCTSAVPEKGPA
jgi:glutathione S-transferase